MTTLRSLLIAAALLVSGQSFATPLISVDPGTDLSLNGVLEDNNSLFHADLGMVFLDGFKVNATGPGPVSLTGSEALSGLFQADYFVFDRIGHGPGRNELDGTLSFDSEIAGIAATRTVIQADLSLFDGFDITGALGQINRHDSLAITGPNSLSFSLNTYTGADGFLVFTAVPEALETLVLSGPSLQQGPVDIPAPLPVALLGATLFGLALRRRG